MADPGLPEIQQEALKVVGGEALSQNKVAAEHLGKKYQEEGARAALEDARANREIGVSKEKRQMAVENNIYLDPKSPDVHQQAKRNQAQRAIERTNHYVKESFDNLTDAEKKNFREAVLTKMRGTTYLQGLYQSLTPPQREALAEGLLKDPNFCRTVNHRLQEGVDKQITEEEKKKMAAKFGITHEEAAGRLETAWIGSLENVIGDVAGEHFRQQLDLADKTWRDEKDSIQNEDAKRTIDRLDKDWTNEEYGKERTQRDYKAFVKDGVEGMASLTPQEKARAASDPDFKAKLEEKVLQRTVELQLRYGNKLKEKDWYKLADKFGQDKVTEAFENYTGLKDKLQEAKAKGLVDLNFWEKVKKLPRKTWFQVMMALLGVALVGAVGIPALAVKG